MNIMDGQSSAPKPPSPEALGLESHDCQGLDINREVVAMVVVGQVVGSALLNWG